MPALSPTMTEGTIVKWLKKEGDTFSPGDTLCEVQTDKAIVGLELEEEGILAKIIIKEDTKDIKIGTLIALMVEEGEDWKNVEVPEDVETTSLSTAKEESKEKPSVEKVASQTIMGPSVRNLLQHYAISPEEIKGTGPRNILLKSDVLSHIEKNNLTPQVIEKQKSQESTKPVSKTTATQSYVDIELSNMRKTIAKRLTMSKTTIPHSYMVMDCNINLVVELRQKLKTAGSQVSINDYIIKAGKSFTPCSFQKPWCF